MIVKILLQKTIGIKGNNMIKIMITIILFSFNAYAFDSVYDCRTANSHCQSELTPWGTTLYHFPNINFEDYAKKYAGGFDAKLSDYCQKGWFGQSQKLRLNAKFKDGYAGIAAKAIDGREFNLSDPYNYLPKGKMIFVMNNQSRTPYGQHCAIFVLPNDLKYDPKKVADYLKQFE